MTEEQMKIQTEEIINILIGATGGRYSTWNETKSLRVIAAGAAGLIKMNEIIGEALISLTNISRGINDRLDGIAGFLAALVSAKETETKLSEAMLKEYEAFKAEAKEAEE